MRHTTILPSFPSPRLQLQKLHRPQALSRSINGLLELSWRVWTHDWTASSFFEGSRVVIRVVHDHTCALLFLLFCSLIASALPLQTFGDLAFSMKPSIQLRTCESSTRFDPFCTAYPKALPAQNLFTIPDGVMEVDSIVVC